MMSPFLILALLILGAAASIVLSRFRSRYAAGVALVVSSLSLILWLAARSVLTVETALGGELVAWMPLSWSVDHAAWQVSLLLLILLVSSLLLSAADKKLQWRVGPGVSLMLVSAGLLGLWADSLPTMLTAWTMLGIMWTLALGPVVNGEPFRLLRLLGVNWIGVFLFGVAAANMSALTPETVLAGSGWTGTALVWILAAALWQLWVIPFILRRFMTELSRLRVTALMFATPAAIGALLLFRLVDAGLVSPASMLILTVLGLFSLVWGISRAWLETSLSVKTKSGLWFALAGLSLLAAASTESAATLQEIRVWLLAGGVLLMAPVLSEGAALPNRVANRVASRAGSLIAIAAIAAFPFTAGFSALSEMYDSWAASGNWLVFLATLILQALLIAVALWMVWPEVAEQDDTSVQPDGTFWRPLAARLALIIPALALLTPAGLAIASIWSWLAVAVAIGAGFGLFVLLGRADNLRRSLDSALSLPRLPRFPGEKLEDLLLQGMALLQQAASILEGERGLLWLLLLLALFLLVR